MLPVEVGVSLPVFLARFGAEVPDLAAVARHAEDVGLDAVWSGDHLSTDAPLLESTVTLSVAAAVTERIGIGFAVLLLALRQPAWAAKQIATLQLVSGGRVRLGVGVGGQWPREWEAAGIATAGRGARTDALLAALPGLFAGEPTRLVTEPGEPTVTLAPAAPMPPVWVGGMSQHALRRAVRVGAAGWLGSMITPDQLAASAGTLAAIAEREGGRVPAAGVIVFAQLSRQEDSGEAFAAYLSKTYGMPPEYAAKIVVSGPPQRLADRLHDYVAAGASHFVVATFGADVRGQYDLVAEAKAALASG